MKYKYEIIAIIVSWTSFLVWEYYVQQWASNVEGPVIRVDLIFLLPALVMLTLWVIFKIKSQKSKGAE